jgi:uncharacterized membrane protein YeaQ/YmgE (transglycosylase-associated protein family)
MYIHIQWIDLLLILAVAVVCGILGLVTSKHYRGAWFVNIGVGFLGALAGFAVSRSFPVPDVYTLEIGIYRFPITWAVIGSVLFVAGLGFLIKPNRR